MEHNAGILDRGIRVAIGLGLLALVFIGPVTPFGWIGIVPLATGLLGRCPLYQLTGVSTQSNREDRKTSST